MNIKSIFVGGLLAFFGLLLSTSAMAAEINLKLHHFLSPKAPAHAKMLAPWAKRIEEASGGRVKIEIFPSMTLGGKPPQLPQQARDGIVDMVWIVNAYATGAFPRSEVFELPGVHQGNCAATNKAMLAMRDELIKDFKGLEPVFQHVHGGQAIQMADQPVRIPDDLKGLKIRTPSRTGAWVIEALGASPVKTSVGEIPVALSKKVIDGAFIPFEIIPPLKVQEQTKYQIEGPNGQRLGTATFSVAMNKDRWNSLPTDIKKVFRDNSGADWVAEVGEIWDASEVGGIGVATKSGNEHIQLSAEEWSQFETAVLGVKDRWIAEMKEKGIDGWDLYIRAQQLVAENMPR